MFSSASIVIEKLKTDAADLALGNKKAIPLCCLGAMSALK